MICVLFYLTVLYYQKFFEKLNLHSSFLKPCSTCSITILTENMDVHNQRCFDLRVISCFVYSQLVNLENPQINYVATPQYRFVNSQPKSENGFNKSEKWWSGTRVWGILTEWVSDIHAHEIEAKGNHRLTVGSLKGVG